MSKPNVTAKRKRPAPWRIECEGYGAGPGMSFLIHIEFRPTTRGFSLWIYQEDDETGVYRWTCLQQVRRKFTWRNAVRSLAGFRELMSYDPGCSMAFENIPDAVVEQLLLCLVLMPDSGLHDVIETVLAFTDQELAMLRKATGGFCPQWSEYGDEEGEVDDEDADDRIDLACLARAVRDAGLGGGTYGSVCSAMELDPATPRTTVFSLVNKRADNLRVSNALAAKEEGEPIDWKQLLQYPPPDNTELRVGLLKAWIEMKEKPVCQEPGGFHMSGSTFNTLQWLMKSDQTVVLDALHQDSPDDFQGLVDWVLSNAQHYAKSFMKPGMFRSSNQSTFGRALYARIVRLALDVERAAVRAGIPVDTALQIDGQVNALLDY